MDINPLKLRLSEIRGLRGAFSFYRNRIERFDKDLKAFLQVLQSSGEETGHSFPYALKDNILALGTRTTCSSRILENYESSYDATVTCKLKESGGHLLGKTNLDEFAMGSSTENSAFFTSRNPWGPY